MNLFDLSNSQELYSHTSLSVHSLIFLPKNMLLEMHTFVSTEAKQEILTIIGAVYLLSNAAC